jgi:hypothetical protein
MCLPEDLRAVKLFLFTKRVKAMQAKTYWCAVAIFVVGATVGIFGTVFALRHSISTAGSPPSSQAPAVLSAAEQGREAPWVTPPMTKPAFLQNTITVGEDEAPPQVRVDVVIVELDLNDGKPALELSKQSGQPNAGDVAVMPSDKGKALLTELQKEGRIEVLATPRVITTDNQAARILIGQSFPYTTIKTAAAETTQPSANVATIEYRDLGISLQITPKIIPDGTVIMRVIPEISTVAPPAVAPAEGVVGPAFNVQMLESTMMLKVGETAVLGGLKQTQVAGSGWFGLRQTRKKEVLIFLTPEIVTQPTPE